MTMVYSYLGLSDPLVKFNNTLASALVSFRNQNGLATPPLIAGGVFSNNLSETAKFASNAEMAIYTSADDVFKNSDIIFTFVPDSALRTLASSLRGHGIRDKIICHFSSGYNASVLDFDPMNTYVSIMQFSADDEGDDVLFVEGYGDKFTEFINCLALPGIKPATVSSKNKALIVAGLSISDNMPKLITEVCTQIFENALNTNPETKEKLINNRIHLQTPLNLVRNPKALHYHKDALLSDDSTDAAILYGVLLALVSMETVSNPNTKSEIKKIAAQMINESLEEI